MKNFETFQKDSIMQPKANKGEAKLEDRPPQAVVFMATYNGERFLREQLDSILDQTRKDLTLYIRDDGSSDGTVAILEEYAAAHKNIVLVPTGSENLGYPNCFYVLSDMDVDGDYFFFSDQDDVWFPDKVDRAIAFMKEEESRTPGQMLAYYGGYQICDEELNVIGRSPRKDGEVRLHTTLFEACGLEFAMAFNRQAKEFLHQNKPGRTKTRGIWMSMLFSAFGRVVQDPEPCAYYRRHNETTSNRDQTGLKFWLWRVKYFLFGGFGEYKEILRDFEEVVGDKLSGKDQQTIHLFAREKYLPGVFKKVFYPHRLRHRWLDELALRGMFLLGRI